MARQSRKKPISPEPTLRSVAIWNAGIYLRLSVEDERKKENDSIGTQKKVIEGCLQKKTDIYIAKTYQDVNYSGTNFDRPAFQQMLEDMKKGLINCVVVKDLSRLGRNYIETGNYLEKVFPFMGIRFISVNDNYDSLTAQSVDTGLLIPLKNIMHEVYARDISRKVCSQYAVKRKKGEFCGAFAPYGYIKQGSVLVIDEIAAPIVKRVFSMVLEGQSDEVIAQKMNKEEIPSPTQHKVELGILKADKFKECKFWYRSVIKRITENPAYTGNMAQGRFQTSLLQQEHRQIHLPKEQWVVVENTHPPIVSQELYDKVQSIRSNRKKHYEEKIKRSNRPPKTPNMFKGLVVCGNCGSSVIRHKTVRDSGKVDYCYLCNVYEQVSKTACVKLSFSEKMLIDCVEEVFRTQMELFDQLKPLISRQEQRGDTKGKVQEQQKLIRSLYQQIEQIANMQNGLSADLQDGLISKEDYHYFCGEYEKDIQALKEKVADLEKQCDELNLNNQPWVQHMRLLADQEFGQQLIQTFIKKILLFPDNRVKIILNYQDELQELLARLGGIE